MLVTDPPTGNSNPEKDSSPIVSKGDPRVPAERLVGFGGRMTLKSCAPLIADGSMSLLDFVADFREKHTLKTKSNEPMFSLLEMGGLARTRIERMVMSHLTDYFKRKISDANQKQLSELLDNSYSFLTVPELRPIAIAVLERIDEVDISTWREIVENGLEESPYIDMPITIKRRIWTALPRAFSCEIESVLSQVVDHSDAQNVSDYMMRQNRVTSRAENKVLQRLLKLLGNNDDLHVQLIDKMVETAATEQSAAKRTGIANLFHDVMTTIAPRSMPNVEKLRIMARHLDAGGQNEYIGLGELREIRDGLSENASCGPVALLVSSVYTRDLITEQLVNKLVEHKKKLAEGRDEKTSLITLSGSLKRDQILENLTYICLSNIKSLRVLSENAPIDQSQTEVFYEEFYPRLCHEMALDDASMIESYHTRNAVLPHDMFMLAAKKGAFERRVLTGYGLMLFAHNNLVGLSKLRLVFDQVFSSANPDEETREYAISHGLVAAVTE